MRHPGLLMVFVNQSFDLCISQPAYISAVGGATFDLNFMYGTAGFPEASPLDFNVTGFSGVTSVRLSSSA